MIWAVAWTGWFGVPGSAVFSFGSWTPGLDCLGVAIWGTVLRSGSG